MKIQGKITISLTRSDGVAVINLRDKNASIGFAEVEMTPLQFYKALSGLAGVDCDIELGGLDKLGKMMEHKYLEFKMPPSDYHNREAIAIQEAINKCPKDGWIADGYFRSQNSFFRKDGEEWARCTIRRWV